MIPDTEDLKKWLIACGYIILAGLVLRCIFNFMM